MNDATETQGAPDSPDCLQTETSKRRFPAVAFAAACAAGLAAGAWSWGFARAAMDVAAGESPVAMAGRENAMNAFHRAAYRLWLKLALEPQDLELKEKFVRRPESAD